MSLKKRVAFTLILSIIFNFLGNSVAFSEIVFKAVGVKDNTKIISNKYKSKNGFQYVKDGVIYTTPAFDFHIFSKEVNLNAHTNGNIATKDLITNAAFGTNQSTELKLNEENYFMNSAKGINNIASDGNIVVGSKVPTSIENDRVKIGGDGNLLEQSKSANVYKETSESINYIDIDSELDNLKVISNLFAENSTSNGVTLSALNGEKQTITVDKNIIDKNSYLNIKASEISNGANKRVINIEIPKGKTLIINVDMSEVDINYLQNLVTVINNYSNAEEVVKYENNILWNLYDSSAGDKLFSTGDNYAYVGTSDYFMGTILAPNANIRYGAVNGSVIANKTQQNGQESHKWTFTGHSAESTKETSAVIEASKKLIGKTLETERFSFNLLDEDGKVVQTASNDKDGNIKFKSIPYNSEGVYKYKVEEVKGDLNGVSYDERVFDVTVKVSYDEKGNLVADVMYPDGKIEFVNKYEAKGTSVSLEANKKLIGKTLVDGMFSFNLLNEDGKVIQTAMNDKDGNIKFTALPYDKVGEYKYTVQEVKGSSNGITYDIKVFNVTVNVSDNGNGNLVAKVIYPEGKIEFTNKYEAKGTSVAIEATKILTGKTLEAEMFSFNLLDESGKIIQKVNNNKDGLIKFAPITYNSVGDYKYKVEEVKGNLNEVTYDTKVFEVKVKVSDDGNGNLVANVEYPDGKIEFVNKYEAKGTSAVIEANKKLIGKTLEEGMFSFNLLDESGKVIQIVKNDKDGNVKFISLPYDKAGEYKYTVQELKGNLNGITYDTKVFNVTVNVSDDGKGNLVANVAYPDGKIEFINKYEAKGTSAVIEANKKLIGKTLVDGMFSFNLLNENGDVIQTASNDKDGNIKFTAIPYNNVGDHKYKVEEVKGSLNGIAYDTKVFNVTVNVGDDGKGNLVANVAYPDGKIEFINKYEAKATSVSLEANKKLIGKILEAEMFSFNLVGENGKVIETVKNDKDGNIKFASLPYNKVGEYKYTVQEVKGNSNGITYDTKVFNVTVNVSDDGNGNLVANVEYPDGKIEFTNKYEAKGTSVAIEATKILTGKTLEARMFSFNLLDESGKVIETVKNDKDGNIKFASLPYNKVGEYKYTVQEVKGNLNGITYDTKVFNVTVKVSDDGNGNLVANVEYPDGKIEFINKYEAKGTSVSLEASKKLMGKTLEAEMFNFNLLNENGDVIQTASNDKDGNIKFTALAYDKAGEYKYTVQEVKGSSNGITYDTKVFNVTVNVSDDGNGNLVANVTYPDGKIIFENKVIKGSLEITKVGYENGKYLENAEFTIRDAEGKVVATGKTDKNGKVLFEGLEYGKYTYEETVQPKGYILDNKKYSFEIKEDGVVVKYTMTNKEDPGDKTITNNSTTPNTGDTGMVTPLLILILGVGGLFINNKRKIKNKIS